MHRLRTLTLALLLAPALAAAQVTLTETSDYEFGDDERINIQECSGAVASTFSISWQVATTTTGTPQVDVRVSDTTGCPLGTGSGVQAKTASLGTTSGTSGTVSPARTASNLVSLLGFTCDGNNLKPLYVCAVTTNSGQTTEPSQVATVQLDTQVPATPTITGVTPGDGALSVNWNAANGAERYQVTATPQGGGDPVRSDELANATSHRLGGLANGVTYDVTVVAISLAGNPSVASAAVAGAPVPVDDFWARYQRSGGNEEGGCGHAAGALALLGLVPLVLRRKRS